MRYVGLCAGIGGICYAAQISGMEVVAQVEIDEFCRLILEIRFPKSKKYDNVKNVRGDEFGAIDIISAGFPCQPFSVAGKREGANDDRFLWGEIIRIIRVAKPTWVLLENVPGILSMEMPHKEIGMEGEAIICEAKMVMETIRAEMQETGYSTCTISIPACAVEATHERQRVFILGHTERRRLYRESRRWTGKEFEDGHSQFENVPYCECVRFQRQRKFIKRMYSEKNNQREAIKSINGNKQYIRTYKPKLVRDDDGVSCRVDGCRKLEDFRGLFEKFERELENLMTKLKWNSFLGQEQYEYEPPRTASKVKNAKSRIKALGNAVVPWQVYPIIKAIQIIEEG